MEALYSEGELAFLQSKVWWVACNQTPFLVKAAVFQGTTMLLNITDLRTLWGARIDDKKIMKDKQIYAKTLQVSSAKELISFFEGILANPDQNARYKFIRKTTGDLIIEIQKQIQVYPLTWKFQLIQLQCDMVHMLCKDIINPLVRTLNAQQKRMEIMRRKMKILQQNLMNKMTETQKSYYKSALVQDDQDLKLLVKQPKQQQFIADMHLQARSKFFFERSMIGFKNLNQTEKPVQKQKEKVTKIEKRVGVFNNQLNAQQILNELQMKKQDEKEKQKNKKKKKKDIDFI